MPSGSTPGALPLLLDPAELAEHLDDARVRIVDLSPQDVYAEHHAPGAVHLPYGAIVRTAPPVGGLLPQPDELQRTLRAAGIDPDTHVVCMDAEGGGAAGRLLWTLEAHGHAAGSLVDGGLVAWVNEGFPLEAGPGPSVDAGTIKIARPVARVADAEAIMDRLGNEDFLPLDARSAGEYTGADVRAARGGHIPGAVHYEWTRAMDRGRNLRLRPFDELRAELAELGVTPERETAVYCHTHHRSAFSYAMLRALGHERVLGYPGSWSDWGNRDDTPVEMDA